MEINLIIVALGLLTLCCGFMFWAMIIMARSISDLQKEYIADKELQIENVIKALDEM